MAESITLPFWPSSFQCLSWSDEDCIAVAGTEQVAVLCPAFNIDDDTKPPSREVTLFKTNGFTVAEAPLLYPLSWARFSVGEELSFRSVLLLAWSASGLATYRRCALAVLTSNFVLSIWDCDGLPQSSEAWHRVAIVNHAIRQFYSTGEVATTAGAGATSTDNRTETLQSKQRIRAFAWAEPFDITGGLQGRSQRSLEWGEFLIAVSTEAGDIVFLSVRNPNLPFLQNDATQEWDVHIEHHLDCIIHMTAMPYTNSILTATPIISHIAWSHWTYAEGCGWSTVAYIMGNMLFGFRIECRRLTEPSTLSVSSSTPRCLLPSSTAVTGPVSFRPGTHEVVVAADDRIYFVDTIFADEIPSEQSVTGSHHLDGRIDPVTGMAWADDTLAIVSNLSTASATTTILNSPGIANNTTKRPTWQKAITTHKASYGSSNGFPGQVQERTWGVATSPFGDYIATCITLHPSRSLAYIINSDQQCIVSITPNISSKDGLAKSQLDGARATARRTAEALLSRSQLYPHEERGTMSTNELLKYDTIPPDDDLSLLATDSEETSNLSPREIVSFLRARLFKDAGMRAARAQCLYNISQRKPNLVELASPQMMRGLVDWALRVPRSQIRCTGASGLSLRIFQQVRARLESHGMLAEITDVESCVVCQQSIPFESVKWARCRAGHQSWRCSLSLLAIQQPGATRGCTLCRARYLNRTGMMTLDRDGDEQGGEETLSLLSVLFAACDVCLCCGGKFGG